MAEMKDLINWDGNTGMTVMILSAFMAARMLLFSLMFREIFFFKLFILFLIIGIVAFVIPDQTKKE